jgi:signal transduction histidine kinase
MEVEIIYFIAIISMVASVAAIIALLMTSHIRSRELVIKKDKIHELELKSRELDKLKAIAFAEEEQMRRIGRYLHDDVGSSLHLLLHMLENSSTSIAESNEEIREKASNLTRKCIESVRMTSQELVPYFLINFGITRTLQSMTEDGYEHSGIEMHFSEQLQWNPEELDAERKIQLYRLTQEIQSNIIRHAKPSRINMRLETLSDRLILTLSHNGVGISQSEFEKLLNSGKSLGLKNIHYRSILLQGRLTYDRQSDYSSITIEIPKYTPV